MLSNSTGTFNTTIETHPYHYQHYHPNQTDSRVCCCQLTFAYDQLREDFDVIINGVIAKHGILQQ